jgi:hypothetical protein
LAFGNSTTFSVAWMNVSSHVHQFSSCSFFISRGHSTGT